MAYSLEIGAFTARAGRIPSFRSVSVSNSTEAHYGPVLAALGLTDAGEANGAWTPLPAAKLTGLDIERLHYVDGIPEHQLEDLLELQGDVVVCAGGEATVFARLA